MNAIRQLSKKACSFLSVVMALPWTQAAHADPGLYPARPLLGSTHFFRKSLHDIEVNLRAQALRMYHIGFRCQTNSIDRSEEENPDCCLHRRADRHNQETFAFAV